MKGSDAIGLGMYSGWLFVLIDWGLLF